MKRATIVELCSAAVLFLIISIFPQQLMLGGLALAGLAKHCPLEHTMESVRVAQLQVKISDDLQSKSRIARKDADGLELWDTPKGQFWLPSGSARALFQDMAEQVRDIYGYRGHGVQAGDIVLDCGANIGLYTKTALNAGARLVVAIEPAPENLRCLRRNFEREIQAGRVLIYPKGVWDKDDVLPMHIDPKNSAEDSFVVRHEGSHAVGGVPLTTIDKLVAELRLDRVDYIKFDIEGAERRALVGARATIGKHHPRMAVCVYHLADDPVAIPDAIRPAWQGYRTECGPCLVSQAHVLPEVFFYY